MCSSWMHLTEQWTCLMINSHSLHQQNRLWAVQMMMTRWICPQMIVLYSFIIWCFLPLAIQLRVCLVSRLIKIELLSSFKKTYNRCCEHNVKKVFLKHEWLEKIKPLTSHCLLWDFELISCVTDCYFIINCLIVFSFVGYIVFERGDLIFVFNFHPENTYEGYALYVQFSFVFRDINCDRLCIYVW